MNNNNLTTVLIKKYNVKIIKKWGQNFLINNNIIKQTIKVANIRGRDVVEIGPGLGALTLPLLNEAKSVTAYEIDQQMQSILETEITTSNFYLIKKDFLKADFKWNKKKKIVASIPYNITTDIIFKIIKNIDKFKSATLILQKEFAERILAVPKTKNYGKLSVSLQSVAKIKKIIIIKNTSFWPVPKVDSMLIKINFYDIYKEDYFKFILNCFTQRRKKLFNNLKKITNQEKIINIFQKMKLSQNIRPQELSVVEFKKLWSYFQ